MSLFVGTNSIYIQNNDQQEEEEDLEDQKRRQEELQNLIANAFDDDVVYDDEQSTLNSSFESTEVSKYRSNLQDTTNGNLHDNSQNLINNYKNTSFNSNDQLQVLYQARVQEVKELTKQLDILKVESKNERDGAQKKNLLLEADYKRTNLLLENSQKLLLEKNEELNNRHKEVLQLKEVVDNLKQTNAKCEEELRHWKNESNDLQQRLLLMEKGLNNVVSEKTIRTRYENEINDLQNALQLTNSKLDKFEKECYSLQNNVKEAEHAKEIIIAEKADVINSITKSLEDSQAHCYQLLSKISTIQAEKQALESELMQSNKSKDKNSSKCQSPNKQQEELINTLKDELKRSLDEQSQKRNEIIKLENVIKKMTQAEQLTLEFKQVAEKQNKDHLDHINELQLESETVSKENEILKQTIKDLEKKTCSIQNEKRNQEYVEQTKKLKTRNLDICKKYENLKQTVKTFEEKINQLQIEKQSYEDISKENEMLKEKYKTLEIKLSEKNSDEKSSEKQNVSIIYKEEYEKLQTELNELQKQVEDSKIWNERYATSKEQCLKLQEIIVEINSKLSESQVQIHNLKERLQLKEERDSLIEDLQKKAIMFEDYMTNKPRHQFLKVNKATSTSDIFQLCDIKQDHSDRVEVDKMLAEKSMHLLILLKENKTLKNKIVFDRNAFSKLVELKIIECNKLHNLINSLNKQYQKLRKKNKSLVVEVKKKHNNFIKTVNKLLEAKAQIKEIKEDRKHHEKRLKEEYDQISKKFEDLLETVQIKINKCITLNSLL